LAKGIRDLLSKVHKSSKNKTEIEMKLLKLTFTPIF